MFRSFCPLAFASAFYDKLKDAKDYYRRYPSGTFKARVRASHRVQHFRVPFAGVCCVPFSPFPIRLILIQNEDESEMIKRTPDVQFSGEEFHGRSVRNSVEG